MRMNYLDDEDIDPYGEVDFGGRKNQKKRRKIFIVIILIAIGALGSVVAANISLSSGRVEFGQGTYLIRACDQWVAVRLNAGAVGENGLSNVASMELIGLDAKRCSGSQFTIKAYTSNSITALNLFTGTISAGTTGSVDVVALKVNPTVPSSFACASEYNRYARKSVSLVNKAAANVSYSDTYHTLAYDATTAVYKITFQTPLATVASVNSVTIESANITSSSPSYTTGICVDVIETGLQLYLDASNSASYSGSGTAWNDLSENDRNFTWGATPSYNSSGIKYFRTKNNRANGPASNSFSLSNTSGYTILMTFYQENLTSGSAFQFYNTGVHGRGINAHTTWSDGNVYWDQGGCCTSAARTFISLPNSTGTWHVLALRNDYAATSRTIWDGNTLLTTNTAAIANLDLTTAAATIGSTLSHNGIWDARIGQFVLYNRSLSNAELTTVVNLLKAKVGL